MKKTLWAVINVNEGRIISLKNTKKECKESIKWLRFADTLNASKSKYIVEREDRI